MEHTYLFTRLNRGSSVIDINHLPVPLKIFSFTTCFEKRVAPKNATVGVPSVRFSPLTGLIVGGTWGTIRQRSSSSLFYRRPLRAVLAWTRVSTPWYCPSSISSANHGITHPPRCPEWWFFRGIRGMWHAQTMQVSISWQLPEEVPVDPQGSWSCSAPSHWSCDPSRRCRRVHLHGNKKVKVSEKVVLREGWSLIRLLFYQGFHCMHKVQGLAQTWTTCSTPAIWASACTLRGCGGFKFGEYCLL